MRVKGVAIQYSELLEAAGVDTVKELRNRRADNLQAKMAEVNGAKKLVRSVPSLSAVTKWVAQAKELKPALQYQGREPVTPRRGFVVLGPSKGGRNAEGIS